MEIIASDRHVCNVSIAQELKIAEKHVWYNLNISGYKKKLDVCVPHDLTQKNLMDPISILESKQNRPISLGSLTETTKTFRKKLLKLELSLSNLLIYRLDLKGLP